MFYILFLYCFHTHCVSQFRLATFQVLNSHMLLSWIGSLRPITKVTQDKGIGMASQIAVFAFLTVRNISFKE